MEHYLKKLENTIHKRWNQKALCDFEGEAFTYADLATSIEQFRIFLSDAGITKRNKIQNAGLLETVIDIVMSNIAGLTNPTKLTSVVDAFPGIPFVACCDDKGEVTDFSLSKAVKAARDAKIAVVCAGLPDLFPDTRPCRCDMRPLTRNRNIIF